MKNLLHAFSTVIFCIVICATTKAQLPDGSQAPDFTLQDVEGNTHNLYAYLAQGYTVILDFSGHWCLPCWNYHSTGTLSSIYDLHGPETGDSTIMVFMMDYGDSGGPSTIAELYGAGDSQGNWVTGTNYPIILVETAPNTPQVYTDYDINSYPSIYTVCPNGIVTQTGTGSQTQYIQFIEDVCQPVPNDALALGYIGEDIFCGYISPTFEFGNLGTNDIQNAEFELYLDGVLTESKSWTGLLSPLFKTTISFSPIVSLNPIVNLELLIGTVNGTPDEDPSDNSSTHQLETAPTLINTDVIVEGFTDAYANETYWAIVNTAGTIVAEGGNESVGLTNIGVGNGAPSNGPGTYANQTAFSSTVSLVLSGCYEVILTDYWGDGILNGGYFRIIDPLSLDTLYNIPGNSFTDYKSSARRKGNDCPQVITHNTSSQSTGVYSADDLLISTSSINANSVGPVFYTAGDDGILLNSGFETDGSFPFEAIMLDCNPDN